MKADPTLESIWRARDKISAKCDFDSKKLIEFYKEKQRLHGDRIVSKESIAKENITKQSH